MWPGLLTVCVKSLWRLCGFSAARHSLRLRSYPSEEDWCWTQLQFSAGPVHFFRFGDSLAEAGTSFLT